MLLQENFKHLRISTITTNTGLSSLLRVFETHVLHMLLFLDVATLHYTSRASLTIVVNKILVFFLFVRMYGFSHDIHVENHYIRAEKILISLAPIGIPIMGVFIH